MSDPTGRTTLVTGASSGLGLAAARSSQRTGRSPDDIRDDWASNAAARRLAEPNEIGRVVGFLCSEDASYVTGQAVVVDGGYVKGL